MNAAYLRGIYWRLAGVVMLVVVLALTVNAYLSHGTFERALAPQMANKVASVGMSIRGLVLKAVENGVAFEELYGVTERFKELRTEMREVSTVAITDAHGKVLHHIGGNSVELVAHFSSAPVLALLSTPSAVAPVARVAHQYIVSMPINTAEVALGVLHIGVDKRFVDSLVMDMLFDVLVVLVVSLFFTIELLHFMAGARMEASLRALGDTFERGAAGNFVVPRPMPPEQAFGGLLGLMNGTLVRIGAAYAALARDVEDGRRVPAHERQPGLADAHSGLVAMASRYRFASAKAEPANDQSQLAKIRAPLFVFILAEELTRSFLPGYVNDLLVPIPGLSAQMVVGLPIALFMLIVAIGQPFFGVYCDRVGHRRTMLIGATIAAAGFVATSMASSVLDLLLWRSLCAVGYAMVFVAGQAYVLDHAAPTQRARSFALFVGAIMAATVCGPSIGGILADNLGVRATFFIAACLAALSIMVIQGLPDGSTDPKGRPPARLLQWREIGSLVCNRRFMFVTALAAMPAKILLTGVGFYLIPMYVLSIGSTQAMAGRMLMAYAVVMVLLAPLTANLATSRERMHWLVGGGLLVSGLGSMVMLAGAGVGWLFVAITLVGVGQSMSISAQSALVSEHCQAEVAQMGEGAVYGVYRLLERTGNALGPLIAAGLLLRFDYQTSFVVIGGAVVLCGAAFLAATRRSMSVALATA